jgi:hypothetical protein
MSRVNPTWRISSEASREGALPATCVHVGLTAQDYYSAFQLGTEVELIGLRDISGVSLHAIQALEKRTAELKAENTALNAEVQRLRVALTARLTRLEAVSIQT